MKLSFIVPCYNEAENVTLFQNAVIDVFSATEYDFEIIYIDDGSTDTTLAELQALHKEQKCPVKVWS